MKANLNSRKTKTLCEIDWKIREIFSETALASLSKEIENKNNYLSIEKKYSDL